MTITAFKTERGAYSPDLIFMPTLESFRDVFARSNYLAFVMNSHLRLDRLDFSVLYFCDSGCL